MIFGRARRGLRHCMFYVIISTQLPLVKSTTCSAGLAFVGYPQCANTCLFICDKYCGDITADATCPCRIPMYLEEIAACLNSSCSPGDYADVKTKAARTCALYGYNITEYFNGTGAVTSSSATLGASSSVAESTLATTPAVSSAQTTATGQSTGAANRGKGKAGVPTAGIVGAAVGGSIGLVLGGAIVYLYARRYYKKKLEHARKESASHIPLVRYNSPQLPPPPLRTTPDSPSELHSSPAVRHEMAASNLYCEADYCPSPEHARRPSRQLQLSPRVETTDPNPPLWI